MDSIANLYTPNIFPLIRISLVLWYIAENQLTKLGYICERKNNNFQIKNIKDIYKIRKGKPGHRRSLWWFSLLRRFPVKFRFSGEFSGTATCL